MQDMAETIDTTDFGFEQVSPAEKTERVRGVFESVAARYDIMNDVMSVGLHRLWKRFAVELAAVRPGARVLDIAGGTADMTRLFLDKAGPTGEVWLTDINGAMLTVGRDRMLDEGRVAPVAQCDAERLPFPDNYFDVTCIAFGLRNVTRKESALAEMRRVTRPGGRALVLEFSRINPVLGPAYDWYSFNVLPRMGKLIAGDEASYRYLAESIRMHPDQRALESMMQAAGLEGIEYFNLAGGLVAVHRGYKY
ncbi:MAG: bifunctional demethylmenaquinone methyltransferase/2-methoxy-6-polyprenyl-1,4-benzoquinol methylase UbiE [Betaproteobacteria bacterium]